MTQIAAHLCLSGFVGNNWEEVVGSRTGIGFRPRCPSYCSEQAPRGKAVQVQLHSGRMEAMVMAQAGIGGVLGGGVDCRGGLGGWITVLFGFTEWNSKRKSLFTLASSVSSFIFLTHTQTFPFLCTHLHLSAHTRLIYPYKLPIYKTVSFVSACECVKSS